MGAVRIRRKYWFEPRVVLGHDDLANHSTKDIDQIDVEISENSPADLYLETNETASEIETIERSVENSEKSRSKTNLLRHPSRPLPKIPEVVVHRRNYEQEIFEQPVQSASGSVNQGRPLPEIPQVSGHRKHKKKQISAEPSESASESVNQGRPLPEIPQVSGHRIHKKKQIPAEPVESARESVNQGRPLPEIPRHRRPADLDSAENSLEFGSEPINEERDVILDQVEEIAEVVDEPEKPQIEQKVPRARARAPASHF